MLAIIKEEPKRGAVALREVPVPEIGPDEVLVAVRAAAICGSDLNAYNYYPDYHFMPLPVILGHEVSGDVVSVGAHVTGFSPGDRVAAESIWSCGTASRINCFWDSPLFHCYSPGG